MSATATRAIDGLVNVDMGDRKQPDAFADKVLDLLVGRIDLLTASDEGLATDREQMTDHGALGDENVMDASAVGVLLIQKDASTTDLLPHQGGESAVVL